MELKTYNITPSVPLDYLGTDKFKKARFSVALSLPADSNNYSVGTLLFPTSMRGTESYENFAALCRRCDELYASDISDMASLRGGISMLGLRAQMLDNKYVSEKERAEGFDILDGVLGVMSEILFAPRLLDRHIENEKLNLINRIKAQVNDPFGFAMRRLREIVADALDLTLVVTERSDSSLGSCMCAGVAVGYFADLDDAVLHTQRIVEETKPIEENTKKYEMLFLKYKRIGKFLSELTD